VDVVTGDGTFPLTREASGHFSGFVPNAGTGTRYKYRLDGGDAFPDPASRWQPDGPHGESAVVDPAAYRWSDAGWRGTGPEGHVGYEMHVGTFTPEGTYAAAAGQLAELAGLGITMLELMPVAEFPGRFGWGYDGVDLFAPYHGYGTPDDLRRFVDRAHAEGLAVILDVVYNHVGPDGNYLSQFSDAYFSRKHRTEWGDAINFDDAHCGPVREFMLANVRHWIAEYHFDGLRLDATHSIYDDSDPHILREVGEAARDAAAGRQVVIVAESEPQDPRLVRPAADGGLGLDQVWCDDFHHATHVAATGRREAYFTDYRGRPQEFISLAKHSILYQGQHYRWQKQRRGFPAWNVDPHRCVFYLENHDQVANSRDGRRLHQLTSPGRYRALTALLLLSPQTPLLFQGQEFGASSPFLYFADHTPDLAALVRKGRAGFLSQFDSIRDSNGHSMLHDPGDPATFEVSRLDFSERERHAPAHRLHRDLIALRRCDPVFASGAAQVDGAVLGGHTFVLRFFGDGGEDRLLLVNLGADVTLEVAPEPLLAPADREAGWTRLWYSEDPSYGGRGAPPPELENGSWRIPAESAILLASGVK
jgi:maltooligosyltrehalose trehalohydrolase